MGKHIALDARMGSPAPLLPILDSDILALFGA